MPASPLNVALIGCGQIADAHLSEIAKIPTVRVVAVCDQHADLARQAAERFGVPRRFTDLRAMLADVRPDVLHITTPPQTHRPLAIAALRAGAHVYVEKPFALDAAEADEIYADARAADRLVCAGHDQLFDPIWVQARQLIETGRLGDVVHVNSIQGYDLAGPFGRAVASEPDHWVHRLPGGLFHNVISHAIYRVTDFFDDDEVRIAADWFAPRGTAGAMPSELRAMLRCGGVTANLMFSSTARPVQRIARIYGTRGGIEVDLDAQAIRRQRAARLPGALAKIESPFHHLREAAATLTRNVWRFVRSDIHYFAGMNALLRQFYDAILTGGESPISAAHVRRVTSVMDQLFAQCRPDASSATERLDEAIQLQPRERIAS
jgi:predicted dehydrogenase